MADALERVEMLENHSFRFEVPLFYEEIEKLRPSVRIRTVAGVGGEEAVLVDLCDEMVELATINSDLLMTEIGI